MTAIDTFADLLRTLDENPPLREALAVRILPPEVLELPQRLDNLAADMQRQAEQHAQDNARQFAAQERRAEQHAQDNARQFAAQERRAEQHAQDNARQFAALTEQVAANTQQIAANTQQIAALDQKVEDYQQANQERFDAQDRRREEREQASEQRFRRIENDLAYLKGSHARYAALEYAEVIAEEMGLEYVRSLTRPELYRMVRNADTTGIPANALSSFRHADLIMEALNAARETCYIAVEISFTADSRDTGRAIRNAGFLTRFTGREAHPAVAGVYQDNEIQPQIESGAVFWQHLPRKDMEAE